MEAKIHDGFFDLKSQTGDLRNVCEAEKKALSTVSALQDIGVSRETLIS